MGNSKKKGSKAERLACEVLREWSGLDFRRVPQSGGLRGHVMEYTVGDIICVDPSFTTKIFPFTIEVKNYKKIDFSTLIRRRNPRSKTEYVNCEIDGWWSQAEADAKRGSKIPILFMRFDNLPKDMFFVVLSRRHSKALELPRKNRLITNKYVILSSHDLVEIAWSKFIKRGVKLWQSMFG